MLCCKNVNVARYIQIYIYIQIEIVYNSDSDVDSMVMIVIVVVMVVIMVIIMAIVMQWRRQGEKSRVDKKRAPKAREHLGGPGACSPGKIFKY